MPGSSARCLQRYICCSYNNAESTVNIPRYNRIHWQQSWQGKEAAGDCQSAACSGARPRRPPAVQAPPKPAEAHGTRRSAQGSPKHASTPEGAHRSSQRPWSLKSRIRPELKSKPVVRVEDQSKRRSLKRKSRPEVRFETGSSRLSRNLGFRRYCRLQMSRP